MSFNDKEEVMLKQVPEGSVALNAQFDRLRERLFDHQVFQRSRGEFKFLTHTLQKLTEKAESATDFLRRLDRIFADARTVASIYAQFVQDGHNDAAAEILLALADRSQLLPQEEILSDHTVPYTLLMFEPEKTLYLLKLCFNWSGDAMWEFSKSKWASRWRALASGLREVRKKAADVKVSLVELPKDMQELCRSFPSIPSLLSEIREYVPNFQPCLTGEAYCRDVTLQFEHKANKQLRQYFHDGWRLHPAKKAARSNLFSQQYSGSSSSLFDYNRACAYEYLKFLECSNCAYLLKGDRSEIISHFPRPMQDRIATWQFRIPENVRTFFYNVGLHIEAEHDRWTRERPSFCSKNLHSGWGAMILHHDRHYAVRYDLDEEVTRITLQC